MTPLSRLALSAPDPCRTISSSLTMDNPGRGKHLARCVPRELGPNPRSPSFTTILDSVLNPTNPRNQSQCPTQQKHQAISLTHCKQTTNWVRSVIPQSRSACPPPPDPRSRPSPHPSPQYTPASNRPPAGPHPADRGS